MRRPKALVIDNDLRIVDEVAEIFTSLGHTYQCAPNLEAARKAIRAKQFSYVLLNLDVPARSKGGTPHFQNGINLLEELCGPHQPRRLPVIILLGQRLQRSMPAAKILDLVVALMQKGAASIIRKPLSGKARVLDRAIKKALIYHHSLVVPSRPAASVAESAAPRRFEGGEMTFCPDRVELCGVKVLGDTGAGQTRRILEELARGGEKGQFVARGGASLARAVEAAGGQNAVAGYVRNFRKGVVRALAERGITCGLQDVIQSGGQGYRLRDRITVRHVGQAAGALAEAGR